MNNTAKTASASERDEREQPTAEPDEIPARAIIVCTQCGTREEQLHLGCNLCEDCCDCRPG